MENGRFQNHTWYKPAINLSFIFAIIVVSLMLFIAIMNLRTGVYLEHVGGILTTFATDICDGIFYRPLFDPVIGTGGTRYMPLHPLLQAFGITIGIPALMSGQIIALLSTALVLFAFFIIMRHEGYSAKIAFILTSFLLLGKSVLFASHSIRGDILPVGFTLVGLVLFIKNHEISYKQLLVIVQFFVLACLTKITALNGLAVVITILLIQRKFRMFFFTSIVFTVEMILFAGLFNMLSNGTFLESMRSCSSAGVGIVQTITTAGFSFVQHLTGNFDKSTGCFFLAAVAIIPLALTERPRIDIPLLFLLITFAMTFIIMGSPGTDYNHFVDLLVGSIWFIMHTVARTKGKRILLIIPVLCIVLGIRFGLGYLIRSGQDVISKPAPSYVQFNLVQSITTNKSDPILFENPSVAHLMNVHPFLFDPFLYRILSQNFPEIRNGIEGKVVAKGFSAIVLMQDPFTPESENWYSKVHLGAPLISAIRKNYHVAKKAGQNVVLVPN